MPKIEHVGIAVTDLNKAMAVYEKILGEKAYKIEDQEIEKVRVAFFKTGDSKIELLEATDESSAIYQFISKKGAGVHHIALATNDINAEVERLKSEGLVLIEGYPRKGADNKMVAFLHPRSVEGTLVELCQEM